MLNFLNLLAACVLALTVLTAHAAELRPGKVFRDCAECPEMVVIPAGRFMMGSPTDEKGRDSDEGPLHEVSVKSFALGRTEVTLGEFRRFVRATGYKTDAERDVGDKGCFARDKSDGKWEWRVGRYWDNPGFKQNDKQPVACLSWNDAKEYVKWLSNASGKSYRLPSEAEWEYAARAGSVTARYYWGNNPDEACRYANVTDQTTHEGQSWAIKHECRDGHWFTAPVANYAANAFGLHDMIGNVWEWVEDCYHDSYSGAPTDGSAWGLLRRLLSLRIWSYSGAPTDGSAWSGDCTVRGLRGGSWYSDPDYARSAKRYGSVASIRINFTGFRPARMLP